MTRRRRSAISRTAVALIVVGASCLGSSGGVDASFMATGQGPAAARAVVVPAAATPAPSASGQNVTVSWTATQIVPGVSAARYTVRRFNGSGTLLATLTDCATGGATSCVDSGLANGDYKFTVAAGYQSWNGPQSAFSATVTAGAAASFTITSPTTVSALPSTVTGTIVGFTVGANLTFRLDSPTGTVLSGTPATVSSSTSQSVSITLPVGTTDGAHSIFVIGSGGSQASAALTVAVPPRLQSLVMSDVNGNGKVDRVVATFDDALAAYTAGIGPWTLANVPSGGTLASVSVFGTQATLTFTEGVGAADTAVGSFTIALAANANGVRDAAGNQSSFAATAPSDAARPVAMTITDTNGLTDGRFELGDTISITFSEALQTSTVPTTSTLTLADQGLPTDNLTIGGVSANSRDLGGADYIGNNKTATFANSAVVLSNANRTITVTVGVCAGDCGQLRTQATAVPYSYLPAATITDPAGNASTTVRTVSIRLF